LYKGKNGPLHESQWNDLSIFQQNHPNDLEGLSKRIDEFRVKLRE
jgi:hypothetical protein